MRSRPSSRLIEFTIERPPQSFSDAASTGAFTAFRGFEWSSDTFGHVNVYFSSNVNNAKKDGGTPDSLFKWLLKPAAQGGGGDGIATFNHPGAKGTAGSPQFNWNDFGFRRPFRGRRVQRRRRRREDEPAVLHQGRAHDRCVVLRAPVSGRREKLQQDEADSHRGVRR